MFEKRKLFRLFLIIFIMADVIGTGLTLRAFPQFTIEKEALLGENGNNLKEFELADGGRLTSVSDDPWIYYGFGELVNIRFITVETSGVSGPDTNAQFYLMPSAGYRSVPLADGGLSARFGSAQGCIGVGGIRLDMATDAGVTLSVERVIVNRRLAVILDVQRLLAIAAALLCLILSEVLGWRRLFLERREAGGKAGKQKKPYLLMSAACVQAVLKLLLVWIFRGQLMNNDGIGSQYLLCRMLVLGTEILCIMAVHLGAGKWRTNIWLSYTLVIPFAVVQFSMAELLNMVSFDFQTPEYLALNLLLCALVPSVLLFFLRSGAFALSASSLIFTALSIGNHYYGILRDNPLEYFDIANAGTAVHVVSNYTFLPDRQTAASAIVMVILILVLFSAFGRKGCGFRLRTMAGNLVMTAAAMAIFYFNIPVFGNFSNLQIITSEKGYLLSFASFIKMGQIKKPDGYEAGIAEKILSEKLTDASRTSKSPVQELYGTENGDGETAAPNIIVIMDETLADLPAIYGFETTEDTLPNIHGMTENTIHGRVLASVYGGGTANTEYEFLTGNSLYYLPMGSSPYVQYVGSHQQSLAWKLKNMGYSTAAYHPYLAISYRRSAAYPLLGLDPFYTVDDELPCEEYLRSYISDSADFKNVIYLYEQREEGQPFFIFNVTMQNHGGYSLDEPAVDVTVRPVDEELNTAPLLEYLSLIHETDAAFRELVDYFSEVEEDTIILMFGDHQPSMDSDVNAFLDQTILDRGEELDSQRHYYATFVMWANFDIEEKNDVITSPGYLRALLLEQAGVEMNAYERFLLELSREYPAMNAFGYLNAEGEWHSRTDTSEGMLREYQYLVYNNIFDKKNWNSDYYE